MGKILTTLRGIEAAEVESSSRGETAAVGEMGTLEAEAVPYIEIGPRRLVEASPGVLDSVPAGRALARGLPPPHCVGFRKLPPVSKPALAPELLAHHAPDQPAAAQYGGLLTSLL